MASETGIIPDLYFPEDDQELQTSSVEGREGGGQGGEVKKKKPVDLTPEGFIPIHKLTLEDLPEPIRTEEHLQYILDISKNVVKVNNNCLSDKRPDDDEFKQNKQKSLCGSGYTDSCSRCLVDVITNRHVLYNEEELCKSTFDVFYDYHVGDPNDEKKLFKRSVRKKGKFFYMKLSKDDIVIAVYEVKDEMRARIWENCFVKDFTKSHPQLLKHPNVAGDPNTPPVVCPISHPLGQPKHVSFGELLDYNMYSRTVHHSAPSKPGSSGGRTLVFARTLILLPIFHVGKMKGKGYASVNPSVTSLSDLSTNLFNEKKRRNFIQNITAGEMPQKLTASLEKRCLTALVPVFGAFLLHTQEPCLPARDSSTLKPCKTSLEVPHDLKQSVGELIQSLTQVAPSFILCPSSNSGDASDLVSLLEAQGPCYCQSIVKMMERGVKLEDGTVTECYLSPNTATAKLSSDGDVTWPWLNRNNSDVRNDDEVEECILEKCLKSCDGDVFAVILLLMITKANACVKELYLQPCDASSTATDSNSDSQWETVYVRTTHVHSSEQKAKKWPGERQDSPPQAKMKNLSSSRAQTEGEGSRFFEDILTFLDPVLSFSAIFSVHLPEDKLNMLYSRCVALSEHARQHELQDHPDTERARGDNGGNWCQCGRPGSGELSVGGLQVLWSTLATMIGGIDAFETKMSPILRLIEINKENSLNVPFATCLHAFSLELFHSIPSKTSPAEKSEEISTTPEPHLPPDDSLCLLLDANSHRRHSLMLLLASNKAFLYNFRLLVRLISKHLQALYFAFPVSVFGRPGNWPGNVTPPEVQRTAWRLIQDAIMASGFRPAVLVDLEKDADRREKLIDLYVDMKQLKWERRIHPHLFKQHLVFSARTRFNYVQSIVSFADATHYYVWYSAYLVCPRILEYRGSTSQRK